MSKITGKKIFREIQDYSTHYGEVLYNHLNNETELQIIDGILTENSMKLFPKLGYELQILQYRENINRKLETWGKMMAGQPITPTTENLINERRTIILTNFDNFIYIIQKCARKRRHAIDNNLCTNACKAKTIIINLTSKSLPTALEQFFVEGPNSVPHVFGSLKSLKIKMEKDLRDASIAFFRSENSFYPSITELGSFKAVILELCSQAPSNSRQVQFYCNIYESYTERLKMFEHGLNPEHFNEDPLIKDFIPKGTILTLADKGLGLVLLPIDWYDQQFKIQSEKGGHISTQLTHDKCIILLKHEIQSFRSSLSFEEKTAFYSVFSKANPKCAVGVLKIVPKIHKVKYLNSQSCNLVPSRPIRGAENCPINPYSKALCKLLQDLHNMVKIQMQSKYPIILGCDEYSKKIQQIRYPADGWCLNTLISADFSDAYTRSNLEDLEKSITKLGNFVDWPQSKISLSKKISKLVFENCYFETPCGIHKQTQGFPMGGHSSREGLDTILLSSEVDLLYDKDIENHLHYYYRLVDDISVAVKGNIQVVKTLVQKMASVYPSSMPLNIQVSFGYSHFLDSHVFNMCQPGLENRLTTSLAYKPLSRFEYVPYGSNIAPTYKGKFNLIFCIKT